jgi:5-formyltetrahydrofolate cyclo-ligase
MILLPGVAFTQKGDRLGHGMGYYDKFLSEYFGKYPNSSDHKTHLIGLAFQQQILTDIPTDDNDYKLDLVLTF